MKTRICPICDQEIKGTWCKTCKRFVTPVEYESSFRLNESTDNTDYFELQMEATNKENQDKGSGERYVAPVLNECRDDSTHKPESAKMERAANTATTRDYREMFGTNPTKPKHTAEENRRRTKLIITIVIILIVLAEFIPLILNLAWKKSTTSKVPDTSGTTTNAEDRYIYSDADHNTIVAEGEESNAVAHMSYDGQKAAALLDARVKEIYPNAKMRTSEENYSVHDTQSTNETDQTCYYTFADWDGLDDEGAVIYLQYDTVSGKMISAGITMPDGKNAKSLMTGFYADLTGTDEDTAAKELAFPDEPDSYAVTVDQIEIYAAKESSGKIMNGKTYTYYMSAAQ